MKSYLDASVFVPLFVDDLHRPRVRRWLSENPTIAVSAWTVAEFSSALSHHVRLGRLTPNERGRAEALCDEWLTEHGLSAAATAGDMLQARELMKRQGSLRAGDALHLAIALRGGMAMATLDGTLAQAAVAVGARLADL